MVVAIRATWQPWQTWHVVSSAEVAEPVGRALAAPCAYRKSHPGILMVQSAYDRRQDNASGCLGGT